MERPSSTKSKEDVKNKLKRAKKTIKAHKCSSSTSSITSPSSAILEEDEYIPVAACDSKWIGISLLDNKSTSTLEDEDEEQEIQVLDIDSEEELPLYVLFPVLHEKLPERKSLTESTTDITKLLVGQKPKFPLLKKSKKLPSTQMSLPTVSELPGEEKDQETIPNQPQKLSINQNVSDKMFENPEISTSINEQYDDSSNKNVKRIKKKKKHKKKLVIKASTEIESSCSTLNLAFKRTQKRQKKSVKQQRTIKQSSSTGNLADDEST